MISNQRIIIGSEVNDDRKLELDELGSKITIPTSLYNSSGTLLNPAKEDGNLASIKTATELIDDGIYTVGSGTISKGMLILGADGTTPRPPMVDASGHLQVDVVAGLGGSRHIDDAAFTVATDDITPMGGMFDDVSPDSVDEGDAGVVRMSANRNLYVTLRDAAGNERGLNIDSSGYLTEANSSAIKTAVEIIDDWDDSDAAKVRLQGLGAPTTTEVTLTSANTDYKLPSSELANRKTLIISNNDDITVYVGQTGQIDADASPPIGIPVVPSTSKAFDGQKDWYGQCDSAGKKVTTTEMA